MTPEDIEDLFKRTDGVVLPDNGDEDDATLTEAEKQYRIAHLRAVLLEAHNAWVSGSEDLDRITEKLGDGSRYREPIPLFLPVPSPWPQYAHTSVHSSLAIAHRRIRYSKLLSGHFAHTWLEATLEISCSPPDRKFLCRYR